MWEWIGGWGQEGLLLASLIQPFMERSRGVEITIRGPGLPPSPATY